MARLPRVRPRLGARTPAGRTLLELLFVVSLMVTLAGIAVPALLTSLDEGRTVSAARYMASRAHLARAEAVKRSAAVGLRFDEDAAGVRFRVYLDGNRNGIRSADIARGIDVPLGGFERIEDQFPGVRFGIMEGVPLVGESQGAGPDENPVRFGTGRILTFTPAGTATPGTLYLRGRGQRQFAVRVLGATGRTRVMEYIPGARKWITR